MSWDRAYSHFVFYMSMLITECTFLILDKHYYSETQNEIESLIGDTNLFLIQEDNSEDGETNTVVAEAEIMIAEERVRGKRFGWESMLLMLKYGQTNLKCTKFIVKIGLSNLKSINMFTKMQFYEVGRSLVFEEITFERPCSADWISWLDKQIDFRLEKYE